MKRTKLNIAGKSSVAQIKREIQAKVREIVIKRDGGCILRKIRGCGGDIGQAVLQADHLISRSNSATFADTRLIVCVCRPCHAWKSLGGNLRKAQYDFLIKKLLPKKIVKLWEQCEQDSWKPKSTRSHDWKLTLLALDVEYKKMLKK